MVFSRTIMGGAIDASCQKDHQRIGRCLSGKIRYVTAGRLERGKDGWAPFTPQIPPYLRHWAANAQREKTCERIHRSFCVLRMR